jgi:hypothetical protein
VERRPRRTFPCDATPLLPVNNGSVHWFADFSERMYTGYRLCHMLVYKYDIRKSYHNSATEGVPRDNSQTPLKFHKIELERS